MKDFLDIKINDKEYHIPTSFDTLTFEQYCKVFYKLPKPSDEDDEVTKYKKMRECESVIVSRLLGEKDDFCLGLPLNIYALINNSIQFIYDYDFFMKNAKAGITIDKKRYSIPPMNEMPLRQYIDADMVMKEEENDMQYIELLSILLTPKDSKGNYIPYDGNYQELFAKLRYMSCRDTLPLVYHFFKKSHSSRLLSQHSTTETADNLQHQAIQSS